MDAGIKPLTPQSRYSRIAFPVPVPTARTVPNSITHFVLPGSKALHNSEIECT